MTYNEALAEIVTWITDNNNKEITAAVMRDVLTTLLDYSADNIGDTGDLFAETNTVDAINELKSLIDGIDLTLGLQVHNGTADPNVTPPSGGYAAPDIYVREDDALKEVYIFNGKTWVQIVNFSFPIYEAGIFKGNATSLDFVGGNFTLTFDPITGVMSVAVTGEGVDALDDIGDVPAYPNDGSEYVLVELDGDLTWELKAGGGGGVDSVTGDSVDNSDPANPVVNAIPLSGTEVGSPVTGPIKFNVSNYPNTYNDFLWWESPGNSLLALGQGDGAEPYLRIHNDWVDSAVEVTGRSIQFKKLSGNSFTSIVNDGLNGLLLGTDSGSATNKRGLSATQYFGANYNDNTYVQKKYVDDNFVDEAPKDGKPYARQDGDWVAAEGGGGGQVDSVSGVTNEIEVTGTATDRVVGLAQAAKDSLALADTSLQPGDEFSGDYNDLTNKPDLTPYVKKDGSTPFTSPQEGVPGTDPNHLATVSQLGAGVSNPLYEIVLTGLESVGAEDPYITTLSDSQITDNGIIPVENWVDGIQTNGATQIWINNTPITKNQYVLQSDGGAGHEIVLNTSFPVNTTDTIILRINHNAELLDIPIKEIENDIVLRLEPHATGTLFNQKYVGGQLPLDPVTALNQNVGTVYDTGKRGLVLQMTSGTLPTLVSRTGMNAGISISDSVITMPGTSLFKLFHAINPVWGFRAKVFFESSSNGLNTTIVTTSNVGNTATVGILIRKTTSNTLLVSITKGESGVPLAAITSITTVNIDQTNTIIVNVNGTGVGNGELIINGVSEVFDIGIGVDSPHAGGIIIGGVGYLIGSLELRSTIYTNTEKTWFLTYNPPLQIGVSRPVKKWDINPKIENLFSDVSGTIQAVENDEVRYIKNNVSLPDNTPERYLTAPVSGAQLKVNQVNGLNALLFNGVDNNYNFSEQVIPELCGSWCVFIFVRNTDPTYGSHVLSGTRYFVITGEDYEGAYSDPYGVIHGAVLADSVSAPPIGTTDEYQIFAIRREGRKVSVYNKLGQKDENNTFDSQIHFNKMGEAASGIGVDWNMDGEIVRIVKYNGNLSDNQIRSVINILKKSL